MNLNRLLTTIFVFCAIVGHSQFKRSYNHYYRTSSLYQNFVLEQPNDEIDLVRAEFNQTNDLVLTTSSINSSGEVQAVDQHTFAGQGIAGATPMITGVFDEGANRIIMFIMASTSTMNYYVLKYNRLTGVEVGHYLHADVYKKNFVNSIRNGNELVNYGVKSAGGLYRITFNIQTISTFLEETVDISSTSIGSGTNTVIGRDSGKILIFNGKEVTTFSAGAKQIYERASANSYNIHSLNANSTGTCNLALLPNGNLFVHNNNDLFELNNVFGIVNTTTLAAPGAITSVEYGIVNNQLHQFVSFQAANSCFYNVYDLGFTLLSSTNISNQKFNNIIERNNGLLVTASTTVENQVNAMYDGDNTNFSSSPVSIEYFETTASPLPTQEFRHSDVINNLHVDLGLGNQLFPVTTDNTAGMEFNDSISLTYHAANIYIGFTPTDTLGINNNIYEPYFLPGPYTTSGMYSDLVSDKYNRGFYVTRQMIEDHLDSLDFGSAGYIAPHGIANWPAHGNIALGQAADLAAFVDVNSNGDYEPYLGDYPSIYGDYCFFSITHDNPNTVRTASVETHSYKYWFDCDTSQAYENTIFSKSLYFSRVENFIEFKLGTSTDQDLGNFNDDYIGTHVELGLVYNYNGDANDENMSGRPGFLDKCPAAGIMVLKGTKVDIDGLDNPDGITQNGSVNGYGFGDMIIDNEFVGLEHSVSFISSAAPGQSDPQVDIQYANYLSGLWQFGDPFYYGGSGFPGNAPTTIAAKFVYPGATDTLMYGTGGIDPGFEWSEVDPFGNGSASNQSGDRRFIASTGSQKLLVGDTVTYDIVYVISNDTNVVTSIDQASNNLFAKCKIIKADFNQNAGSCGINFNPIEEDLAIKEQKIDNVLVYPNPTDTRFKIAGLLNQNASIAIYDLEGRLLFEQQNINTQTEFSVEEFKGNLFMVSIQDGSNHYIKRIVKN